MLISVSLWEHFLNLCTGKLRFCCIFAPYRAIAIAVARTWGLTVLFSGKIFKKRTCRTFKSFHSILHHWAPLPAVPTAHPHLNSLCVVRGGFNSSSLLMHNSNKNGLKNIIMQRAMRVHNRSKLTEQEEKEWNFSFRTALCCSNLNMQIAAGIIVEYPLSLALKWLNQNIVFIRIRSKLEYYCACKHSECNA